MRQRSRPELILAEHPRLASRLAGSCGVLCLAQGRLGTLNVEARVARMAMRTVGN
jgi:hypothetical protein